MIPGQGCCCFGPLWRLPSLRSLIAGAGPAAFQKQVDGRISLASRWLLLPYRLGARINIRWWTRRLPAAVEIADGVFLGRFPGRGELSTYVAVIDMEAELPALAASGLAWHAFPSLDLLAVPADRLRAASLAVEEARQRGPVLVCCALGFQRSAVVAACWLIRAGLATNAPAAVAQIAARGRRVHLKIETYAAIEEAAR